MITHETENYIIIHPSYKIFTAKAVEEVCDFLRNIDSSKDVAIDMGNVYSISAEFMMMINSLDKKLALLNCCPEVLVLLNITNSDKNVKIFTNRLDLEEDKRELRNRKFALV